MIIELGPGNNPIHEGTPDIITKNVDYRMDISADSKSEVRGTTVSLPFKDDSIDAIVCQHVIEHHTHCSFGDNPTYGTLLIFLKEVRRVLKVGGYIEVMCPNFAYIAKAYQYGRRGLADSLTLMQWAMGGQRDPFDHHGVLLDKDIAGFYAFKAGFKTLTMLHPEDWFGLHFKLEK